MSESELLKELASKIGKNDDELLLKLREIYDLLRKRSFAERLKMGEDAIKAYVGR